MIGKCCAIDYTMQSASQLRYLIGAAIATHIEFDVNVVVVVIIIANDIVVVDSFASAARCCCLYPRLGFIVLLISPTAQRHMCSLLLSYMPIRGAVRNTYICSLYVQNSNI